MPPPLALNNSLLISEETTAPNMLYSATMHTSIAKPELSMKRSLSESCLEGILRNGDLEPFRFTLKKPFMELLKAPTATINNLPRCVSLPEFVASSELMIIQECSVLGKEHRKKSCPSLTFCQPTKKTAKTSISMLNEGSGDATTSSFTDSSSQGISSMDTDFDNLSSDCDDYSVYYVETEQDAQAHEEEYDHEYEHYDVLMEHTIYPQENAAVSAPVPFISETSNEPQPQQSQHSIQSLINNEDWTELMSLVERDPGVCRERVNMIFQNENITCLPLHAVVCRRGAGILSVVDCLVTTYPAALMRKEEGGDRLPLHMAILKGASIAIIRYLMEARPQALEKADCEGNLPIHYAAMYSSEHVIRVTADRYPAACRHANLKERMPLHIVCARNWDHQDFDLISLDQIHWIFQQWPAAVQHADRNGCLPLHVACSQPQPRWDVLNLLIEAYSVGLLHKDDEERMPLQICRRIASSALATLSTLSLTSTSALPTAFCRDNDVVLAYLRDKTNQEKRKQLRERIFTIRIKRG